MRIPPDANAPPRNLIFPAWRRPPRAGARHVAAFCRSISPDFAPTYVEAHDVAGMRPSMCFHNVASLCRQYGGQIGYGWLIWEWEATLIEAEHHAVWCKDSTRIEVTPREPFHARVLFLPQPDLAFDFATLRRHDNKRMALRNDARVREYLALAARIVAIEESNTEGGDVVLSHYAAHEILSLKARLSEVEHQLASWSLNRLGPNDGCWCGSGKKVKRCCGLPALPGGM